MNNMAEQGSFAIGIFIVIALIGGCATTASRHADAPAFQSGYAPVNGLKMYGSSDFPMGS
jgi:uncharacterized protein YceK